MVKEIICKNGEVVLCDDEDYPLLSRFTWYMGSELKNGGGYPCCFIYGKKNTRQQIFMHQLVMAGFMADHRDLNKMNCQKDNLRVCTREENEWNKPKQKTSKGKPCTSQYKGVSLCNGKWRSQIKRNGVLYRLGEFSNELDAAKAYNKKAAELSGKFVWLNPLPDVNHQFRTRDSGGKDA